MSNLKIGIDSRILKTHPKRGSSRHLVSVISSIEKNSVILFSNEYIDLSEFGLDGYKLIVGGVKNYLVWEQLFLPYFLVKNKINYLYSPNHTSPFISPCNKIIAVYDLIFSIYASPKYFFDKGYFGSVYRYLTTSYSIFSGARVITISNFTKNSILNKYSIDHNRITFISCPYLRSAEFQLPNYNRHRLLMVTGAMKHKNFDNGIQGFLRSNCRNKYVLTIVGVDPDAIDTSKYPESIEWKFNVSNLELSKIYTETEIFLFPSLIEGFGIPLLEAMEFGAKICCSGNSVFPEICGNSALYFDPYSIDDIARTIDRCNGIPVDTASFTKKLSSFGQSTIQIQVDSLLEQL
jgi:glycosyltransferase involved in cell wall biosynthesis